jgi:hypothetical protein
MSKVRVACAVLLLVVGGTALLAGCGGSSSSQSATPTPSRTAATSNTRATQAPSTTTTATDIPSQQDLANLVGAWNIWVDEYLNKKDPCSGETGAEGLGCWQGFDTSASTSGANVASFAETAAQSVSTGSCQTALSSLDTVATDISNDYATVAADYADGDTVQQASADVTVLYDTISDDFSSYAKQWTTACYS